MHAFLMECFPLPFNYKALLMEMELAQRDRTFLKGVEAKAHQKWEHCITGFIF